MARRRFASRTVEVEVNIEDVLSELDDDQILEEALSRKLGDKIGDGELVEDLLRCLKRGDAAEAIVLLERTLYPKYQSIEICEKAFASLRGKAAS